MSMPAVGIRCLDQNPIRRLHQGVGDEVRRMMRLPFLIMPVDQNRPAVSRCAGVDITPPVADQKTASQIDPVFACRIQHQSRLGLATGTRVSVVVPTGSNFIDRECCGQEAMNGLHGLPTLQAAGYIWLVGDDNQ